MASVAAFRGGVVVGEVVVFGDRICCTALAGLAFTVYKLVLNSWQSSCISFVSVEATRVNTTPACFTTSFTSAFPGPCALSRCSPLWSATAPPGPALFLGYV